MKIDAMSVLVPADRIRNSDLVTPATVEPLDGEVAGAVKMNRFCRSAYRHPFEPVPTSLPRGIWSVGDHVRCPIIHLSMPGSAETMEVSDAIRT